MPENHFRIAFLAISDQYATLIFWKKNYKMAAVVNFGSPKIILDSTSRPFQINMQLFLNFILQDGRRRPFWMAEYHFQFNLSPFQINTQL